MAFHGTFEHTLDAKNRLTVPSKLRTAFAEGAFLVRAADRCISLYPSSTYSALTRRGPRPAEPAVRAGARAQALLPLQRAGGRAGLGRPRDDRRRASWSTRASSGTSSSSAPATAWSSGTPPPGRTTTRTSRRAGLTSPHLLAILLDMPRTHVPVLAGELIEALDPQPGPGRGRLHARRRRPRAPRRRPDRPGRHADRDRPRPARRGGVRRARRRGAVRDPLPARRLRARASRTLAEEGLARGPRLPRPRHVLDAGRHARARLLLRLRRAAGHADGPDAGADRARGRQHVGAPPARARAARVRRGALRRPDRRPDRPRRARSSTTFELVDAITAAIPAPARFAGGHPAKRTFQAIRIAVNEELAQLDAALPLAWEILQARRPAGRDLLPLARGPARQALPRRPHARLHLPARPAGLRLRPHARGRARLPPLRRARPRARSRHNPRSKSARLRAARKLKEEQTDAPARPPPPRPRTAPRTAPAPRRATPRRGPIAGRPRRSPPSRCRAAAARHHRRLRAPPRAPRAPRRRPRPARPRVDLGDRRSCSAASSRCRSRCSSSTPGISHSVEQAGHARARQRRPRDRRSRACPRASGSRAAAAKEGMVAPAGRRRRLPHAPARSRRRAWPLERMTVAQRRGAQQVMANGGRTRAAGRSPPTPIAPTDAVGARRRRAATVTPAGRRAPAPHRAPPAPAPPVAPVAHARRPAGRAGTRRHDGPDGLTMKLIERRIGLLFAVFLGLLVIGAGKAAWLGVVKAGTLQAAPRATQQEADLVVPARRGAITDAQRHRARGLPAGDDDRRHAVPDQGADEGRRRGSPGLLDKPEDEILAPARPPRHRLRLPRPPRPRRPRAQGRRS